MGKNDKKFQKSWLNDPEFASWIKEDVNNSTRALCKVCQSDMRAHRSDLVKHASTRKHQKNCAVIKVSGKKLTQVFASTKLSKLELQLAAFTACHTSIRSIDHLSELIKGLPIPVDIRLHRTKCAALIKKVIAPILLKEQIEDLGAKKFSLIIDESTDIACEKHLCLCIKYYNERLNRIASQFLGLIPVTDTTADVLYNTVVNYLNTLGINVKNCFAIATDGASNLCGINKSLYALMKRDNENLMLLKCICHSLHLACSHAAEELPSNIDYLIRETYNWFHRSALRRESYLKIYELINDGEEPLKLIPLSATRWLARSNAVKRVLAQWDALKLHFQMASSTCDKYYARELHAMYSDSTNLLYLTFLKPVLEDFEKINLLFQRETADHCSVLDDLCNFAKSVLQRILKPEYVNLNINLDEVEDKFLCLERVDYGYEFSNLMLQKIQSNELSVENSMIVQQRCFNFLKQSAKQLLKRIPANIEILEKVKNFSPKICLGHTRPPFSALPLNLIDSNSTEIAKIESQWRLLLTIDWKSLFPREIPVDGAEFWCKAAQLKNGVGECVLSELANYALTFYSLPVSNATVERVFSRVTNTKTKLRNNMGLELLSSIIRIKMNFQENNTCCHNFEPGDKMLNFNSDIYANTKDLNELEIEILDTLEF